MDLQNEKMKNISEDIQKLHRRAKEALEQSPGDGPHDNAPYDAVRMEIELQSKLLRDGRLQLSDCTIMEYPARLERKIVQYGARVIFDLNNKEYDFKLVGFGESDIDQGKMFYEAPLAQQLMGHEEGDVFKVKINNRESEIKIKHIDTI